MILYKKRVGDRTEPRTPLSIDLRRTVTVYHSSNRKMSLVLHTTIGSRVVKSTAPDDSEPVEAAWSTALLAGCLTLVDQQYWWCCEPRRDPPLVVARPGCLKHTIFNNFGIQ